VGRRLSHLNNAPACANLPAKFLERLALYLSEENQEYFVEIRVTEVKCKK